MFITIVNEGEEVVFNCTPTNPFITATFSGNVEVLELFPPNNSVWRFPAELQYSGRYSCSAQFQSAQFESTLRQETFLLVYPNEGKWHGDHSYINGSSTCCVYLSVVLTGTQA